METILLFSAVSFVCWPSCCCGAGGRAADEACILDSEGPVFYRMAWSGVTPASPVPRSRPLEPRQCSDNLLNVHQRLGAHPRTDLQGELLIHSRMAATVVGETLANLSSVSQGTKVALWYCLVWSSGEGHEPCVLSPHCPSSMDSKHRCFLDSSLEGEQASSHLFILRCLLSALLPSDSNSLKSGAPLLPSTMILDKLFNLSQNQISRFQNENSFTALQTSPNDPTVKWEHLLRSNYQAETANANRFYSY